MGDTTTPTADLPIGVFDSGLGGLTVVRALRARLPGEHIVYLGDSARVPYGTRSARTVETYATRCAAFLAARGLKLLVVACNTASAVALPALRRQLSVPVLGVIAAGARAAVNSGARRIGVIGTAGTIGSGAYLAEIAALDPGCEVHQQPAPLLVPLAEEGWLAGEVPLLAARRYLTPLVERRIEALLLGCTHYPLLTGAIREALDALGSTARIIDSASAVTDEVERILDETDQRRAGADGAMSCHVTDLPASFSEVAERFLGGPIGDVERVDIT